MDLSIVVPVIVFAAGAIFAAGLWLGRQIERGDRLKHKSQYQVYDDDIWR